MKNIFNAIKCLCLLIFIAKNAAAQQFMFRTHERSEIKTANNLKAHLLPDTLVVRGDLWPTVKTGTAWTTNLKVKSVNSYVKFYVNHAYPVKIPFNYSYYVCFNVTGYKDSMTKTIFPTDTLRLLYNPDSLKIYQDMVMKKYSDFHKLEIVITSMFSDSGPISVDTIPNTAL
jgi:hypothetical protein